MRLHAVIALDTSVATRHKVSRRGQVGVNDAAPRFPIPRARQIDCDLKVVGVDGTIEIPFVLTQAIMQRKRQELGRRVIPVVLVPGNAVFRKELISTEQRTRCSKLDQALAEGEPILLGRQLGPVKLCHLVIVTVPVVVSVTRLSIFVA